MFPSELPQITLHGVVQASLEASSTGRGRQSGKFANSIPRFVIRGYTCIKQYSRDHWRGADSCCVSAYQEAGTVMRNVQPVIVVGSPMQWSENGTFLFCGPKIIRRRFGFFAWTEAAHRRDSPPQASPSWRQRRWTSRPGCALLAWTSMRRHSARMASVRKIYLI